MIIIVIEKWLNLFVKGFRFSKIQSMKKNEQWRAKYNTISH